MAKFPGYGGTCLIGSTAVVVKQWHVNEKPKLESSTDTGSGSMTIGSDTVYADEDLLVGVGADWDFEGDVDSNAVPGDTSTLVAGGLLTNLKFNVGNTGKFYLFPVARIVNVEITNVAQGKVTFKCSGHAQGAFTRPT